MGPFLRILGYFDWVCDPFIGITREQLLKQNTLAHILRLFLLLTATKLWITSSKHAGKISFPTQVVRKKGKKRPNTDITYYYVCIRLLHIPHWDQKPILIKKSFGSKNTKKRRNFQKILALKILLIWQIFIKSNFGVEN